MSDTAYHTSSGVSTHDKNVEFLSSLWKGGSFGNFVDKRKEPQISHWVDLAENPYVATPIGKQENMYFGVHPLVRIPPRSRRGTSTDPLYIRSQLAYVQIVNCLFAEFDNLKDIDDLIVPCKPSVIVHSGGGFHAYWLLKESKVISSEVIREQLQEVQRVWVHSLAQADRGASDLARMLRLPGFYNSKYKNATGDTEGAEGTGDTGDTESDKATGCVEYVHFDLSITYTLEELFETVGKPVPQPPVDVKKETTSGHVAEWLKPTVDKLKDEFTCLDVFEEMGWLDGGTKQEGDDLRILKHKGLLVGDVTFNCYGESGVKSHCGDIFAAYKFCNTDGQTSDTSKDFIDCVRGLCDLFDVPFPDRWNRYLDLSDIGIAEELREKFGTKFVYAGNEGHKTFTGTHYEQDCESAEIYNAVVQTMRDLQVVVHKSSVEKKQPLLNKLTTNDGKIRSVMSSYKQQNVVPYAQWNRDSHLLNCLNGVVDLRTGELQARDGLYFNYVIPVEYEPGLVCNRYLDLLATTVEDPDHMVPYLHKAFGYSLTGSTASEVFFWLYGPPRSGKGTILTPLETLLQEGRLYATMGKDFFTRQRNGQDFDLMPLKYARMIVQHEPGYIGSRTYFNDEFAKNILGGGNVRVEAKGQDMESITPKCTIWVTSNHTLPVHSDSIGFVSKARLITCPHSNEGKEDPSIKAYWKDPDNLKEVFSWLVAGATAWYKEGIGAIPDSSQAKIEELFNEENPVSLWIEAKLDVLSEEELKEKGYTDTPKGHNKIGEEWLLDLPTAHKHFKMWCFNNSINCGERDDFRTFGKRLVQAKIKTKPKVTRPDGTRKTVLVGAQLK